MSDDHTNHDENFGETTVEHLRRRADHLCGLAAKIERSLASTMGDIANTEHASPRSQLCDRLLTRNLHQLHRAADDIRMTAYQFRLQADRFEANATTAA